MLNALPNKEYAAVFKMAVEHDAIISTEFDAELSYLSQTLLALVGPPAADSSSSESGFREVTQPEFTGGVLVRVPNRIMELIAAKSCAYGSSGNVCLNAELCARIAAAGI